MMIRLLGPLLILAFPLPLAAQDNPLGIAFVQAPEQSFGFAVAATPQAAFARAVQVCAAGGALPEDCLPTNWCQPSGWSIDLFMQHAEGLHWHHVVCGLPSRNHAEQVAMVLCDPDASPWIIECFLVQLHDPDGRPLLPD